MSHRIHNREPIRQPEHLAAIQARHQAKVLTAITRLTRLGKPFSKQEALSESGLYVHGHRAKTYIDRNPVLAAAYQAAMRKLEARASP